MRDDIIERCALAALNRRRKQIGCQPRLSLFEVDSHQWQEIARAVLAAFKEATAEPTPGMVDEARTIMILWSAEHASDTDWDDLAEKAHTALHEQQWKEIGI